MNKITFGKLKPIKLKNTIMATVIAVLFILVSVYFDYRRHLNRVFVPEHFDVPDVLETSQFRLRMLSVNDVDKDYEALMDSRVWLRAHFGGLWPADGFTREENRVDLQRHQDEFENRIAFAYTMVTLDESKVLGCVYINPVSYRNSDYDAEVVFWVRQGPFHRELDETLFKSVKKWLSEEWPFNSVIFPLRNSHFVISS